MDIDRELKKKLMHAENIDDIKSTLKENEIDMTDEEMNAMWEDIKKFLRRHESEVQPSHRSLPRSRGAHPR